MWEAYVIQEDEHTKIYAVVRVRDYNGYPDAPHLEGQITIHKKGERHAEPS